MINDQISPGNRYDRRRPPFTMNNRRIALAIALVVTIVSVLHLLSDNSHNDSDGVINYVLNKRHRSLRQTSPYFDPKTITHKESSPFIIPEANLADTKHAEPTVIRDRSSPQGHIGVVVDVLSIGSKARLELVRTFNCIYALFIFNFIPPMILVTPPPILLTAHCTNGDLGITR